MPQLSIYIDEQTLKQIEIAAKIERLSISKYAVKKLNESMHSKWPEHYEELYGSIKDDAFKVERIDSFKNDAPREEL
jgi:hypothetical protein